MDANKKIEEIKEIVNEEVKKNKDVKLDVRGINSIIKLTRKLLQICLYMAIILIIYFGIVLGKEAGLFELIVNVLGIISPLFIGLVIAWLFNPLVNKLKNRGINRTLSAVLVYVVILGVITLALFALVPTLYTQVQDFAKVIPNVFDKFQNYIDGIFQKLDTIQNFDAWAIRDGLFEQIEGVVTGIASSLPNMLIGIISSFASGMGSIIVGLIIGFFLLVSFESTDSFIDFLPKKIQTATRELLQKIDDALRSFVTGSILDCTFIFIISSIGLYFAGLKAPLLFGLFCGITNIIPYAGPYIGGIPAVLVGFSQGITTGILTLIVLCVIQFLEGNFLQPVILSKTTKLHPVTIILGLLIFGNLWGILGMIISTPLLAASKAIILFFDEKYDILDFN